MQSDPQQSAGVAPALSYAPEWLKAGTLAVAAALIGFGLILYIAANWDDLGRFGRFWLVGAVIGVGALAALADARLRTAGLLLAFAATGGMLALIGQTYQTGADPWSLFALWAVLAVPWMLAARSDAMWTGWVVVVTTAIVLWQQAQGPLDAGLLGWGGSAVQPAPQLLGVHLQLLTAWALGLGLCLSMAPSPGLDRALGSRYWAFRLATAMTLTMIAADTLSAVLVYPRARAADYIAGLASLCGIAAAIAARRRSDITMLAAAGLAVDVALIGGVARLLLGDSQESLGSYLLVGLAAAAIVAASVVVLMRVAGRGAAEDGGAPAAAIRGPELAAARPWAIAVLSGVGSILAAMPFIGALSFLLGPMLRDGATTYAVALALLAVAVPLLRSSRSLFIEQLATVGLACGALLLGWGVFRDLPVAGAGLVTGALALATGLALGRPWLSALLAAAATPLLALPITKALPMPAMHAPRHLYAMVWSIIALAGVAAVLARRAPRNPPPLPVDAAALDAALSGWTAATLAGLAVSSGATFLLSANLGFGHGLLDPGLVRPIAITVGLVSGALAAAGTYLLAREQPSLRAPLGLVPMAAAVVLSLVMPALGATVLVLAAALVTRSRVIALAAVVAGLWIIGAFYYDLAMPLTRKAAILAGTGGLLGAAALLAGRGSVPGLPRTRALSTPEGAAAGSLALARGLTAFGLLAVGGLSTQAIGSREALIRNGTPVFVELAPVDPRSLMQGDYMALRFRLPDAALRHQPRRGEPPRAIGRQDEKGVLQLTRVGTARTPTEPGETAIALKYNGGQWILVTDAWYFKEGTARKWEAARYGELRVLPSGEALLVGLADKDRVPIR